MVAKWQEDKIESALKEAVGETPDARTLWALTLFAKHCRKYCRSNAAFNNFMNRIFSGHAKFVEVPKIDEKTGESYKGLDIRVAE